MSKFNPNPEKSQEKIKVGLVNRSGTQNSINSTIIQKDASQRSIGTPKHQTIVLHSDVSSVNQPYIEETFGTYMTIQGKDFSCLPTFDCQQSYKKYFSQGNMELVLAKLDKSHEEYLSKHGIADRSKIFTFKSNLKMYTKIGQKSLQEGGGLKHFASRKSVSKKVS